MVECYFTHERYSRAVLGARVSQAGLATKQLDISFAPNQKRGFFYSQKEKGGRGSSSRLNAAKPRKSHGFSARKHPADMRAIRTHPKALCGLRAWQLFFCADMTLSSSVDCLILQMFRSLIRIMSSPSAPTLMIVRANFTLVSASFRPAIPQPFNMRVFHGPCLCILFRIHASFEAAWRFAQASKKLSSLRVGAWQRSQNVKRYSGR